MQYVLLAFTLIILFCFFVRTTNTVSKSKLSNFLDEALKINPSLEKLTPIKGDPFDLVLYDKEKNLKYVFKCINIPEYAEVMINNFNTWEVRYGAGNVPGKVQPHKKYLTNIMDFINYSENNTLKVVIFFPKPKKIVKWINECEMIFVDSKTDVYGLRMIACNDFSLFINENKEDS